MFQSPCHRSHERCRDPATGATHRRESAAGAFAAVRRGGQAACAAPPPDETGLQADEAKALALVGPFTCGAAPGAGQPSHVSAREADAARDRRRAASADRPRADRAHDPSIEQGHDTRDLSHSSSRGPDHSRGREGGATPGPGRVASGWRPDPGQLEGSIDPTGVLPWARGIDGHTSTTRHVRMVAPWSRARCLTTASPWKRCGAAPCGCTGVYARRRETDIARRVPRAVLCVPWLERFLFALPRRCGRCCGRCRPCCASSRRPRPPLPAPTTRVCAGSRAARPASLGTTSTRVPWVVATELRWMRGCLPSRPTER
jgi:hypothetical protein